MYFVDQENSVGSDAFERLVGIEDRPIHDSEAS